MTCTWQRSCIAIYLCCSMGLLSIGLSACNPVRLGATLRTGFGRPVQSSEASFTLPSNVAIHIEEDPFDSSAHSIKGCGVRPAPGGSKTCLIGGQLVFGATDELPKTYVAVMTATVGGRTYKLEVSQMYDAWGSRPLEANGVRYFGGGCEDELNCKLRGLFSEAAATYAAEWQIVGGVTVRTLLTDSSDVVAAFKQHIDPPK